MESLPVCMAHSESSATKEARMRGVLSRCLDAVIVCVFCLFLLLGWIGESQAQPRVDESIRPYLSSAAQRALFGPQPQLARESTMPETLQAVPAQPTIGANIQLNDSSTEKPYPEISNTPASKKPLPSFQPATRLLGLVGSTAILVSDWVHPVVRQSSADESFS